MARTDTLPHFLTDVADAIRTKAGTSQPIQASTFDTAIANIPSGGEDGWKRPTDWWDTKTILANAETKTDSQGVTVYPAYIILLADWDKTTTFSATTSNASLRGDGYLTSDGAWYGTAEATHTWDTTKDKPCSLGYKTRYVIVYAKSSFSSTINIKNFKCLEMILGEFGFYQTPVSIGSSSEPINRTIQNFEIDSNATLSGAWGISEYYGFRNCSELRNVNIPLSNISFYSNPFYSCYSLEKINIPNASSVASSNYTFYSCRSLKELNYPSLDMTTSNQASSFSECTALKKIVFGFTTLANNNIFNKCYNLEEMEFPALTSITALNFLNYSPKVEKLTIPSTCTLFATQSGTTPLFGGNLKYLELYNNFAVNNINLTYDTNLVHSCLVDILSKLKDVTGEGTTYTLTLGSTNLAKLTNDEIAIGTSKGWTIN